MLNAHSGKIFLPKIMSHPYWYVHAIIHDAWADNLPVSYHDMDMPHKGYEEKNRPPTFLESFFDTMGYHLWG